MTSNTYLHLPTLIIIVLMLLPVYPATNLSNMKEHVNNLCQKTSFVDGPMNSSWPMYCHDSQRTSRSPYAAEGQFGVEHWRVQFGDMISQTSPAIAEDGTIYIGGPNFYLMAINSDGSEKWRFKCNGYVESSPAIDDDGTIYVGADGDKGYLYAVYPNGTLKWRTLIGNGWTYGSPVIDRQGVIYMTCVIPGNICAVYPNGTLKWKYQTNDWVYCSPTLNHDESIVYCGSNDRYLYALYTSNGTLYWRYNTGGIISAPPTVAANGTIYADGTHLTALQPNGTVIWKTFVGSVSSSSSALAKDGTIYIGNGGGDESYSLKSVNPMDGSINWEYEVDDWITSSPAVDANGVVYFGSWDGRLYALNPNGTLLWKFDTGGHVDCSPAIDEFGRIYFMSHVDLGRSYFFCIETTDEAAILELSEITPRFGHVSVSVTNTGNIAANEISWAFNTWADGILWYTKHHEGSIGGLEPGETRTIRSRLFFGLSLLHITARAIGENAGLVRFDDYFYLIGPFIILRED